MRLTLSYGVNQKSTYIFIYIEHLRHGVWSFPTQLELLSSLGEFFLLLRSVKVPGGSYSRSASPRTESTLPPFHCHVSRRSTVRQTATSDKTTPGRLRGSVVLQKTVHLL